jgi:hypothetical protein
VTPPRVWLAKIGGDTCHEEYVMAVQSSHVQGRERAIPDAVP